MEKLERSIKKFNKRLAKNELFLANSPISKALFAKRSPLNGFCKKHNLDGIIKQIEFDSQQSEQLDDCAPDDKIGLSYLPLQLHRKLMKNVFAFSLMVVGQSGLGKSTLVNSMFFNDIYSEQYPGPSQRISKTTSIESSTIMMCENSVNLMLTIVDTPGFGEALDNRNGWQSISDYIDKRHFDYLNSELYLKRAKIVDHRIHCCLYFIQPTGHFLKTIDIEFMKNLHDKVNIIPVIAKSDTLTPEELEQFKQNIRRDLEFYNIKTFNFPISSSDNYDVELNSRLPLAVVSSNYIYEIDGVRKRGRKYPWGVIDIENTEHCDFKILRDLIIRHGMLELIDHTHNVHYNKYRSRHIQTIYDKAGFKPI